MCVVCGVWASRASANISLVRETMHLERVKELKTQYGSMFNGESLPITHTHSHSPPHTIASMCGIWCVHCILIHTCHTQHPTHTHTHTHTYTHTSPHTHTHPPTPLTHTPSPHTHRYHSAVSHYGHDTSFRVQGNQYASG